MGRHKIIADETILESAQNTFRDNQHESTTRQVAQAAGVSHAVLFQRFPTREDLFFRAFLPTDIHAQLEQLLPAPGEDIVLQDYLTVMGNSIAGLLGEGHVFQDTLLLLTRPGFRDWLEGHPVENRISQIIDRVSDRLDQLRAAGSLAEDIDTVTAARLFVDSLFGAALRSYATGVQINVDEIVSLMVRVIQPGQPI